MVVIEIIIAKSLAAPALRILLQMDLEAFFRGIWKKFIIFKVT